jgi:hypothetical protein
MFINVCLSRVSPMRNKFLAEAESKYYAQYKESDNSQEANNAYYRLTNEAREHYEADQSEILRQFDEYNKIRDNFDEYPLVIQKAYWIIITFDPLRFCLFPKIKELFSPSLLNIYENPPEDKFRDAVKSLYKYFYEELFPSFTAATINEEQFKVWIYIQLYVELLTNTYQFVKSEKKLLDLIKHDSNLISAVYNFITHQDFIPNNSRNKQYYITLHVYDRDRMKAINRLANTISTLNKTRLIFELSCEPKENVLEYCCSQIVFDPNRADVLGDLLDIFCSDYSSLYQYICKIDRSRTEFPTLLALYFFKMRLSIRDFFEKYSDGSDLEKANTIVKIFKLGAKETFQTRFLCVVKSLKNYLREFLKNDIPISIKYKVMDFVN